ncbi:MAG TPA: GNAT family N-acetyltransferase [Gaiellaceae bacterium]|nr:GNAT family N-acetyltransferase [Gaiellaceae bacterium]
MEIVTFGGDHVAAAATLLAARHERHRAAEPLLPELEAARAEVEAAGTSGAAAVDGGDVAGYLVGTVRDDRSWGRHTWVAHGGWAVREPELVRDLYAVAAERWVGEGAKLHIVLTPALPELVDPWLRLGFGHMQAYALRESGGEPQPLPAGVTIRLGTPADLDAAAELLPAIWEHQRGSPTFTGFEIPAAAEYRADWEETLAEHRATWFLAELDRELAGHLLLYPEEPSMAVPAGSVYLAVAATLPEARGRGVGVALTEHALAWAREAGHATVHTDWRVPNLESSRFWPRRGFRETFYRLARQVEIG